MVYSHALSAPTEIRVCATLISLLENQTVSPLFNQCSLIVVYYNYYVKILRDLLKIFANYFF